MLVKFMPEQVAQIWPMMAEGIESALPPIAGNNENRMRNVLTSILTGGLECWISYEVSEAATVLGVVLTAIKTDEFSGNRFLLIYAVYGTNRASNRHWAEGYNTLRRYALENECSDILAYSCVPGIVSMAQRLGADTNYSLIQLPVKLPSLQNSTKESI